MIRLKKKISRQFIFVIFILLILCNCEDDFHNDNRFNQNKDTLRYLTMNDRFINENAVELARKNIFIKGDTSAYKDLRIFYLDQPPGDFLPFALVMADKYKYPLAYFDVYSSIELKNYLTGEKLSKNNVSNKDYSTALSHLKKGAELGDFQCIKTINDLYPELKK